MEDGTHNERDSLLNMPVWQSQKKNSFLFGKFFNNLARNFLSSGARTPRIAVAIIKYEPPSLLKGKEPLIGGQHMPDVVLEPKTYCQQVVALLRKSKHSTPAYRRGNHQSSNDSGSFRKM